MGRNTVNQVRQIGVESTSGTTVAANRLLPALSMTLTPQIDKERFRAAGYKSTTVTAVSGTHATGSYEGPTDFNHIIYPLEGLVGSTGPTGATLAKTRVYTPAAAGADSNAKTFTMEAGDSTAARVFNRVRFRSFQLQAGRRTGTRISGSLYSNYPLDGQTLTASPTPIVQVPVAGSHWNVYLDTTYAGIGTTKLATAYNIGFAVGDKFNPFWALNSANGENMADEAEVPHDINGQVTMMHDAQSRALFAAIPNNATVYIRYEAIGAIIESTTRYRITLDTAVQLANPADDDNDGIYGQVYNFDSIYDASLGGHWRITNVGTVASL